ncbi:hypothetical protein KD050_08485 [Psychrobacillus sp. INOP01]|uniref:hypothetical protein n=1 Tax=Psychrobacillus sp. INOP01 TaxID=2829187 RepID=UPI001BA745F8|nr:hypothetical protein [Psychrobacillus sp. INOP01]QUG43240.1 hypothetical protein KD050_08485 [Psychrobacillus sp. INOP01]
MSTDSNWNIRFHNSLITEELPKLYWVTPLLLFLIDISINIIDISEGVGLHEKA